MIVESEFWDTGGTCSPNGKQLAFITTRAGNEDLGLVALNGTGFTLLTSTEGDEGAIQWSPDGKFVIFSRKDSDADLMTRSLVSL